MIMLDRDGTEIPNESDHLMADEHHSAPPMVTDGTRHVDSANDSHDARFSTIGQALAQHIETEVYTALAIPMLSALEAIDGSLSRLSASA